MTTVKIDKKIVERWKQEDEETRQIRKAKADWKFITSQPSPLREALESFVELGDLYVASRIARMTVDEFNELRIKAKIPMVI